MCIDVVELSEVDCDWVFLLFQPGSEPVTVSHSTLDLHGDEAYVQKAEVSLTSDIQQNQQLYVSVWAINQVW